MMSPTAKQVGMLSSRANREVPLLDDPPIGHLQAVVLKKLEALGSEAFGHNVLEQLTLETRVWIDPAQIYTAIRKLLDKDLIDHIETRAQKGGGAPLKIYKVTASGRAAIKTTARHHRALAEYLEERGEAGST
jgi:DNA-binding MarR family transcriptional regulator